MTRKQNKALRRSKAIKKKQNILRINNRAKSAVAAVAAVSAVLTTPNISAQDTSAQATIEEIVVNSLTLSTNSKFPCTLL